MDGNSHDCASLHFGDSTCCQRILGVLAHIDVAGQLSTTALVNDVGTDLSISNDSGIQLARADSCAVSWD